MDKPEGLSIRKVLEHKRVDGTLDRKSKIAQYVYEHDHSMDFEKIAKVNKAKNYHKKTA